MPPRNAPSTAVVLSELFPPAVGGSAVLLANIYARLPETRVTVLTDAVASQGADRLAPTHVRVVLAPIATRDWGLSPRAIRHQIGVARHLRALRPERPALVHAVRALPEGTAAYLASWATGVPYVCWCHGEDVTAARTSRELTFVMGRVFTAAAGLLANSHHTASLLRDLGVPESKTTVVHPGVDARRFSPTVDGQPVRRQVAPDADIVLLSVGRLQRRKGQDIAIEAVARLAADFPTLRYVIVGEGEERARLMALAAARGVSAAVIFAGEVSDAMLPAWYAACDIFVLPNRQEGHDIEGFGLVFLEAAASGKPVIGGRSGGVPEAIAEGATGHLVSGTDVDELAHTIRRLITTPSARISLGDAGRARVLREFTWDRAASAVAELQTRLAV